MQNSWLDPNWHIEPWEEQDQINHEHSRVFAILEPSLMPDWKTQIEEQVEKQEISSPLQVRLFDDTLYQALEPSPILVELSRLASLQKQWLSQYRDLPLGCFFITPNALDTKALIRLLRHRLTIRKNKHTTFLRYYEPRGLLSFLGALSTEERQDFLSLVQTVVWYHPAARLENSLWLKASWQAQSKPPRLIRPWILSSHQLDNMQQIHAQLSSYNEA